MSPRIALLICDIPAALVDTHGDYTVLFTNLLKNALPSQVLDRSNMDAPPPEAFTLDFYDVVNKMEFPPEDKEYDGIMLTGSAYSAYDSIEWIDRLVEYVSKVPETRPKAKIIGICFGHQIVARAFGGQCVPNGGRWEAGVYSLDLTPVGQRLFEATAGTINLQQMHRDHVPDVPKGFQLLASTPLTPNHGMVRFFPSSSSSATFEQGSSAESIQLRDVHVFTVQGHPEFLKGHVELLVDTRVKNGRMTQENGVEFMDRAGWRNDGVTVVGRTIWKILGVEY